MFKRTLEKSYDWWQNNLDPPQFLFKRGTSDRISPFLKRARGDRILFKHPLNADVSIQDIIGEKVHSFLAKVVMPLGSRVVHSDLDILGGTPVFVGTRVPMKTLLDYLEAGDSLDIFLDHFPSVSREQAIAALELAKEMLTAYTNPA